MSTITFAKHIDSWDHLNRTLKPLIGTMPELAEQQQQLEALILQAKALQSEQGGSLGKLREAVRLRQEAELIGQELHARIAAVLKGKLGFKSNDLYGFGLAPRKTRSKKPSDTPTPPPPVEIAKAPQEPTAPAGPAIE
jgi:hypothetical protein